MSGTDKMTCEDGRERLSIYIDKELPASEEVEVERHLAECSECAAELERLRELTTQLREAPLLDMPLDAAVRLDDAVSAALRERQAASVPSRTRAAATQPWWKWFFRPAFGGLVASVAVLAFAVIVFSGGQMTTLSTDRLPESAQRSSKSVAPKAEETERGRALSSDGEDDAEAGSGVGESNAKASAPPALEADEDASPRVFARDDLLFLSDPDMSDGEREKYEPIEGDGGADSTALFDQSQPAETITSSAAARIVAGEQEAELLFAESGSFDDSTGVTEAWIVVIEMKGVPGVLVAAAVRLDGEVLYRTD